MFENTKYIMISIAQYKEWILFLIFPFAILDDLIALRKEMEK